MDNIPTTGLVIKKVWLDYILSGQKTLEIRSSQTNKRGPIALIESGSGLIVGVCHLTGSHRIDTPELLIEATHKACIPDKNIITGFYKNPHAWHIENAYRLTNPVRYSHPKGAVIWVSLSQDVQAELATKLS